MDRKEVFEKLNEIFQDVFDDESITVNEETTADEKNGFTNYSNGKWTAAGPATVTIYKADGSKLKEETATIA